MNNFFDDFSKWQKEWQRLVAPFQDSAITQIQSSFNEVFDTNSDISKLIGGLKFNDSLISSMQQNSVAFTSFVNQTNHFNEWQATFQSLAGTNALNLNDLIPDSLYDSLIDLTSEFDI